VLSHKFLEAAVSPSRSAASTLWLTQWNSAGSNKPLNLLLLR